MQVLERAFEKTNEKIMPEKTDEQVVYWEALADVEGLGRKTLLKLLSKAGTPEALWHASPDFLMTYLPAGKREAFLKRREQGVNWQMLEIYQRLGIQAIDYSSPLSPELLKEIHDPPLVLYVKGNLAALTGKTLVVVGTRNASEYGRQVTEKLIRELQLAQVSVVSGLAAGIDAFAHWAALRNGLPTVAVFGCGLDIITPASNRALSEHIVEHGGALVSEYRLGTPPSRFSFPQRNRIVAGLSYGILAIEGDIKSGALITARLALEEGRSVFAVPGNIQSAGSQGPLQLIKNGAIPVTCGEDILRDLQTWLESPLQEYPPGKMGSIPLNKKSMPIADKTFEQTQAFKDLSEPERQVLQAIPYDPVSLDDLSHTIGLPFARINEILTLLELEGLIVLLPGAKVCRN